MELDAKEQWTKDLYSRIGRSRRPKPLRNVVQRVANVLAGQDVEFVNNDLRQDDDGTGVSGRIAVFTKDVVAIIEVTGVAEGHSLGAALDRGATSVTFLPRSALTSLTIPATDGTYVNSGEAWGGEASRHGWPPGGVMHLRYEGLPDRLVLPAGDSGEDFDTLLPGLVADLSR